jgi:hypothetical protein
MSRTGLRISIYNKRGDTQELRVFVPRGTDQWHRAGTLCMPAYFATAFVKVLDLGCRALTVPLEIERA